MEWNGVQMNAQLNPPRHIFSDFLSKLRIPNLSPPRTYSNLISAFMAWHSKWCGVMEIRPIWISKADNSAAVHSIPFVPTLVFSPPIQIEKSGTSCI
ncbi:hypothetical protein AVEN_273306-1 [Araneus ventricosus]|uniref:Uncharacterized protein n=1 Tax=Araneus ventricosus TaxID=182803 RepID=A0A4Y2G815_ARAVE|nr:hypothetical protein AVEN_273306-1 [Araneus ventricosus]